jgi:membrane-associated phospholipid phosphatase
VKSASMALMQVVLLVAFTTVSSAQPLDLSQDQPVQGDEERAVEYRPSWAYWKGYIEDTGEIVTSPARWEGSDWIRASLVVGMTVGLYALDQEIRDWAQDSRNGTSDDISAVFEKVGNGLYLLPSLGVFYLYGHLAEDGKARRAALLSLESLVLSGVFTNVLKYSTHRHRPNSGDPYDTWDGPGLSTSDLSFPSGHATTAFSVLTVIASEYGEHTAVPIIAYSAAALAALSRVHDDKHWASDVFFGSALGYFTARAVLRYNEGDSRFMVYPVAREGGAMLMVTYRF